MLKFMLLCQEFWSDGTQNVWKDSPQLFPVFLSVGFVEKDVRVGDDILGLKDEGTKVAKARASTISTGRASCRKIEVG